ncbi:hypothetical protein DACRYDRAFT_116185 [Dacryopinax primogenitus]|uniref:Endoplasmic reticulum junction formation protein lunapark n=1 Tax=Dacryopinax primogenitus (strain DJM 731) TaxID=1858805 RepID=M5G1A3_DACPD|nr:uncharacterized protein DACRYDRAFT_116185 [Dacryopinax primogenitus]EJU02509.1 hypothetical protein DACRYDRAFT_116185 [Dacryopinax primogenitus]
MGNWFSKKSDNYENVLSKLAESIDKKKAQLADIRLRERRMTLLFTLYSLFTWVAYTTLWYLELLPRAWARTQAVKVLSALPVGFVPVSVLSIRRLVHAFYSWRASYEEIALKKLLGEQKAKIEEIKKKTNYDSTRSLLEKYGETSARPVQPSALRQRGPSPIVGSQPSTPLRHDDPPATGNPSGMVIPRPLPPYFQPSPASLPPQTRKWYDTLADALLGPDEQVASREKYALICARCFTHNGLITPSEWEDVQYTCPKCGYFNPSRYSLRRTDSPTVSESPPPAVASGGATLLDTPGAPTVGRIDNFHPVTPPSTDVQEARTATDTDKQSTDETMMDVDTPTVP